MDSKVMQKSFVWNTIGYISYLGFQWLITILVVRLSGYLDAGILSLAMSTTSMFHLIAGYGMRSFQISDAGVYTNKEYLYSRYLTCIGAFLLCIIFVFVNDYSYIEIINIIFYMIFKLGEAFVDVYNGMLQKIWRLDIVGKSYCIRGILSVITFSITLYFIQDLSFAILSMGLSTWLVIIFYDKRWTYKLINVLDRIETKKIFILLKECLPLVIFNFITSYINFIPRYELERTVGTEMLGIYSSISSPTLIVQSFAQVLFIPLIPLFATHFNSKRIKSFCKLLAKCIGILSAIGIVTFIGAALFGEIVFELLLGPQIKEYIYLLFR